MIDKKEIRLGNWTEWNGIKSQITLHDFLEEIETGQCFFHKNPIPLTEEKLLEFGFKEIKKNEYVWWIYARITITHQFELLIDGNLWIELKSVHQLMNIFFALTGKELELKPT